MAAALDGLSWVFVVSGLFFMIVGTIGILRMPDILARLHPAGMTDTMGAFFLLLGMALQTTEWMVLVRLVFIYAFISFTSPVAGHALARAALVGLGKADPPAERGSPQ